MKKLLVFAFVLFTTGCANYFLRKSCEKINWYQHGFNLAMKGQRLSNDDMVTNCRKVDAEISEAKLDQGFKAGMSQYCLPEIVLQTGKKGENFNLDLCDPGQGRILLAKHHDGVREFCQGDNGFQVGASGRVYNKICPADQEKAFLKEYSRGRKKYLQAMLAESLAKTQEMDRDLTEKDRELRNLQYRRSLIPGPTQVIQHHTSPSGQTSTSTSTDDSHKMERDRAASDIGRKNQEIESVRNEQKQVREKTYEYQRELTTMD